MLAHVPVCLTFRTSKNGIAHFLAYHRPYFLLQYIYACSPYLLQQKSSALLIYCRCCGFQTPQHCFLICSTTGQLIFSFSSQYTSYRPSPSYPIAPRIFGEVSQRSEAAPEVKYPLGPPNYYETRFSGHLFSRLCLIGPQQVQTRPISYYMKGERSKSQQHI